MIVPKLPFDFLWNNVAFSHSKLFRSLQAFKTHGRDWNRDENGRVSSLATFGSSARRPCAINTVNSMKLISEYSVQRMICYHSQQRWLVMKRYSWDHVVRTSSRSLFCTNDAAADKGDHIDTIQHHAKIYYDTEISLSRTRYFQDQFFVISENATNHHQP